LKKPKEQPQAVTHPYGPTPYEQKMLAGIRARQAEKPPAPRVTVNGRKLELDHPHEAIGFVRLAEALGTDDLAFVSGALGQISNAASRGREPDERAINFMLSVITGIEPRDQVEAMLAMQMAAVHNATMTFARRLNHIENIPQQDSAERAFNKLARTFAAQVEALQRYRGKGQQRVTVEHVHVHQGGQAIVGTVQGGHQDNLRFNPMHSDLPMHRAPRCHARTRSGKPCQSPAVNGKRRCRMHGGAVGSGAPAGNKNALRHGRYTAEAIARRRHLSDLIRQSRAVIAQIVGSCMRKPTPVRQGTVL
jgi:hypothetical protein